jgi:hypothetical protein
MDNIDSNERIGRCLCLSMEGEVMARTYQVKFTNLTAHWIVNYPTARQAKYAIELYKYAKDIQVKYLGPSASQMAARPLEDSIRVAECMQELHGRIRARGKP